MAFEIDWTLTKKFYPSRFLGGVLLAMISCIPIISNVIIGIVCLYHFTHLIKASNHFAAQKRLYPDYCPNFQNYIRYRKYHYYSFFLGFFPLAILFLMSFNLKLLFLMSVAKLFNIH